jgi:hypothetical protein
MLLLPAYQKGTGRIPRFHQGSHSIALHKNDLPAGYWQGAQILRLALGSEFEYTS